MTYTVDETAVRRVMARLAVEATALRTAGRAVPDAPAGGLGTLVTAVATSLVADAHAHAASFDTAAGNLESAITLSRLADSLAQRRIGPPVPQAPLPDDPVRGWLSRSRGGGSLP